MRANWTAPIITKEEEKKQCQRKLSFNHRSHHWARAGCPRRRSKHRIPPRRERRFIIGRVLKEGEKKVHRWWRLVSSSMKSVVNGLFSEPTKHWKREKASRAHVHLSSFNGYYSGGADERIFSKVLLERKHVDGHRQSKHSSTWIDRFRRMQRLRCWFVQRRRFHCVYYCKSGSWSFGHFHRFSNGRSEMIVRSEMTPRSNGAEWKQATDVGKVTSGKCSFLGEWLNRIMSWRIDGAT